MKRVAIFRSRLLPVSQTFILEQARALRDWQPVLIGFETVPGGLVLSGSQCQVVSRGGKWGFHLRMLLGLPLPHLVHALSALKAELVHVHFGTDATDVWPSVRAAGLPMLVTLHGYDINIQPAWWRQGGGGWLRRLYPQRLLRIARDPSASFIAVSAAIRQRAIQYGIPADRITVSHIGVDLERFRPGGQPLEQRPRRILFVGRMVEKKAPLLLIRAFAEVRRRVPDAGLTMIGDGPLLDGARQLARELGVAVEFAGARSSDEVIAHLQQSRVLCLPSVTAGNGDAEGFGLAMLEAQACGVPVVTSALGGVDEGLLPGRTGHAIAEGDLGSLVDGLCAWLVDDGVAREAATAARQFVQAAFSLQECTTRLERIYDRVSHTVGRA